MQYEIQAKPTMYDGILFRSRLEARWAAMFSLLNIPYSYEPIDLSHWSPDFVVREYLIEVKPQVKLFLPEVIDKIERSVTTTENVFLLSEELNSKEGIKNIYCIENHLPAHAEIFFHGKDGFQFRNIGDFGDLLHHKWKAKTFLDWWYLWNKAGNLTMYQPAKNG